MKIFPVDEVWVANMSMTEMINLNSYQYHGHTIHSSRPHPNQGESSRKWYERSQLINASKIIYTLPCQQATVIEIQPGSMERILGCYQRGDSSFGTLVHGRCETLVRTVGNLGTLAPTTVFDFQKSLNRHESRTRRFVSSPGANSCVC